MKDELLSPEDTVVVIAGLGVSIVKSILEDKPEMAKAGLSLLTTAVEIAGRDHGVGFLNELLKNAGEVARKEMEEKAAAEGKTPEQWKSEVMRKMERDIEQDIKDAMGTDDLEDRRQDWN